MWLSQNLLMQSAANSSVEVIFHGASATDGNSQTASIDMGTSQTGDIQIVGVIGQGGSGNLTLSSPPAMLLFSGRGGSFDEFEIYQLAANQSGPTNFAASATYRNTIFAWTVRGASPQPVDTAYSYETSVSDSLVVPQRGAVLAMSTCQNVSMDVYPDIVEVSDAAFLDIEAGFSTSGGHSDNLAAQTIPLATTNSTAGRSMIAAIAFSPVSTVNAQTVEYLTGVNLANQASDAARTLTLSGGFSTGDFLVAMTANRTDTAPALLPGYTDIVFNNNPGNRSLRMQYKIATGSSETISWTGAYGYILAFSNATRIGAKNTVNDTSLSSTLQIPDLIGLTNNGRGFILAGAYFTDLYTSTTSPYALFNPFGVSLEGNTFSSITGKTLSISSRADKSLYAIEIL